MTRPHGTALRVAVFVGEHDTYRHRPLSSEIVRRAHRAGPAGASVFRGIGGSGASSPIHASRLLPLRGDLPVAIVIADVEERVRAFLPQPDEPVTEGPVILDDCEVARLAGRDGKQRDEGDEA
ncbi:DUF190 domain-containing protein [Streptomyces sp. NPDC016626]|uniref:DUF190 domain-containing protein n=1 Tax=Streptomyces sp. NPDC016626 TaxID=3364968 RepID=UPI0036FE6987